MLVLDIYAEIIKNNNFNIEVLFKINKYNIFINFKIESFIIQ